MAKSADKKLTCLDLFCGCGGFSLGMQRAGFRVLAAIDHNAEASSPYQHPHRFHFPPAARGGVRGWLFLARLSEALQSAPVAREKQHAGNDEILR